MKKMDVRPNTISKCAKTNAEHGEQDLESLFISPLLKTCVSRTPTPARIVKSEREEAAMATREGGEQAPQDKIAIKWRMTKRIDKHTTRSY